MFLTSQRLNTAATIGLLRHGPTASYHKPSRSEVRANTRVSARLRHIARPDEICVRWRRLERDSQRDPRDQHAGDDGCRLHADVTPERRSLTAVTQQTKVKDGETSSVIEVDI